jgi:hypothetical protein
MRKMLDPPTAPGFSILDRIMPYNCTAPDTNCLNSTTEARNGTQPASICIDAFNTYLGDEHVPNFLANYLYDPLTAFTLSSALLTFPPNRIALVECRLSLLFNTLWKAG